MDIDQGQEIESATQMISASNAELTEDDMTVAVKKNKRKPKHRRAKKKDKDSLQQETDTPNKGKPNQTKQAGQGAQGAATQKAEDQKTIQFEMECKICSENLLEHERAFFPCNCKYKVCHKCFWEQINAGNLKCPNCGLLQQVQRMEAFENKLAEKEALALSRQSPKKKTRRRKRKADTKQMQIEKSVEEKTSQTQSQGQNQLKSMLQVVEITSDLTEERKDSIDTHEVERDKSENQQQIKEKNENQEEIKLNLDNIATVQDSNQCQIVIKSSPKQNESMLKESKQILDQQKNNPEERIAQKDQAHVKNKQQTQKQKLGQLRILQRNTLYIIGLSPTIAKPAILKSYEFFGQYGIVTNVTINSEKAFQMEDQGVCLSAYITFLDAKQASLAILAIDQFTFDGRSIRASYGRTKYCRFFLKNSSCTNKECPYLHSEASSEDILTSEDMKKKVLFEECQQLALKLSCLTSSTQIEFEQSLNEHSKEILKHHKLDAPLSRIIMPPLNQIFESRGLFQHCIADPNNVKKYISNAPKVDNCHINREIKPIFQQCKKNEKIQIQSSPAHQNTRPNIVGPIQSQSSSGGLRNQENKNVLSQAPPTQEINRRIQDQNTFEQKMKERAKARGRPRLQSGEHLAQCNLNIIQAAQRSLMVQQPCHQQASDGRQLDYLHRHRPSMQLSQGVYSSLDMQMNHHNKYNNNNHNLQSRILTPSEQANSYGRGDNLALKSSQGFQKMPETSLFYHQESRVTDPQRFNQKQQLVGGGECDQRARSGSQRALDTLVSFQEDTKTLPIHRRRSGSFQKFNLFEPQECLQEEDNSPKDRTEQLKFAEALREALQQAAKQRNEGRGGDYRGAGQDQNSAGYFDSIFTGDFLHNQKNFLDDDEAENASDGAVFKVVKGRAAAPSPIGESILNSRRGSEDRNRQLNRQRSQHSLIVESVQRILDDSALETRERPRPQLFNEGNFKTGPPSEVRGFMAEDQTTPGVENSIFYNDVDNKYASQFNEEFKSSASHQTPGKIPFGLTNHQERSGGGRGGGGVYLSGSAQNNKLTSTPSLRQHNYFNSTTQAHQNAMNRSGSFYNSSPYFLLPANQSRQTAQVRSSAFHDNSLRHLNSWGNHIQLQQPPDRGPNGGRGQHQPNDTWRLTHNPHPLLPKGYQASTTLSSAGNPFCARSDQECFQTHPMLSRTTSQPFMMRSEQKIAPTRVSMNKTRQENTGGGGSSDMQNQFALTRSNLELLNKKNSPSKDMLYEKIFSQRPGSPQIRPADRQESQFGAPQHPISVQHYITPQSLFCFALDGEESDSLRQINQAHKLKMSKKISRDDAFGVLSAGHNRCNFDFDPISSLAKAKESSLTPRHSISKATMNHKKSSKDIQGHRSLKNKVSAEEIDVANQLANEASLGFGDFLYHMQSTGQGPTVVSQGDSTSQRDRRVSPTGCEKNLNDKKMLSNIPKQPLFDNKDRISLKSDTMLADTIHDSELYSSHCNAENQPEDKQAPPHKKDFYAKLLKVNESLRRSSGMLVSSSFQQSNLDQQQRRSSCSWERKRTHQLLLGNRRCSFKHHTNLRNRLITSPLGLLHFKNHQIDEVNEDGITARDDKLETIEDRASTRQNSADGQSYKNLKQKLSVSRSRGCSEH